MASCDKENLGTYIFPIAEEDWDRGIRIPLYMLLLAWTFVGVAIIADVFMGAIEKVTSAKVLRHDKKTGKYFTYELWNPTVANLTLMALGSSAPEILLNVIDIFGKSYFLEGLGPSTIVGSAAFNMLMILAICIISIGNGEIRKIKEMSVYVCTAVWSVFAYVWLIIILMVITPNVVDIWEGVVTFLFFPVLCLMAWMCDKGYIGPGSEDTGTNVADLTDEELAEASKEVRRQYGEELTPDQIARIITHMNWQRKCKRADYRVATIRSMFGGKRIKLAEAPKDVKEQMSFLKANTKQVVPISAKEEMVFSFAAAKYACMENVKTYTIPVNRSGSTAVPGWVKYRTLDGTGKEGKDYEKAENALMFNTGEAAANITLNVLDNTVTEGDREFYVELFEPKVKDDDYEAKLGSTNKATLVVIDNDDAGTISFGQAVMSVNQKVKDYEVEIPINRKNGSNGEVKIKFRTEADSAISGRDFENCDGEVVFADQQVESCVKVTIKSKARWETEDVFRVYLEEPSGGAKIDPETDGGADKDICTIKILAEEGSKEFLGNIKQQLHVSLDKSRVGHNQWKQQFIEAIYVNGGGDDDDEEGASPGVMDWIMHILAVPWKVMFAFCPPTNYCGGWLCFFVALIMIGGVTVLIGDVATLLGCCMCIPEEITAITFVALGTSLPDTFASKAAAQGDPYADAAVGNVTGSNSVNVFLGLGLPWMIASFRWRYGGVSEKWQSQFQLDDSGLYDSLGLPGMRDQAFVVKAGTLGFSVTVFSLCAMCCIAVLQIRRVVVGGELGGPAGLKWGSAGFLVFLWVLYIALSSWKALDNLVGGVQC